MSANAPSKSELGLLGHQINLVINAHSNPQGTYWCDVQQKFLRGEQALGDAKSSRRFLAYDSLPGSVNVMAIGADDKTLFVEVSPYDLEGIASAFAQGVLPAGVRVDAKGIWLGKIKLASASRGSKETEAEHGARTLWTVSRSLPLEHLAVAITVLDGLDGSNAYQLETAGDEAPGVSAASVPAQSGRPRLEMRMNLQMELIAKQVPVLAMRLETRTEMRTEMRAEMRTEMQLSLEFRQLQRFEQWLSRDPEDAIVHALSTDPSPKGQARVVNFIQFKVARDVKNAAASQGRDIPWSEARQIARKLMRRQPVTPK
jgi:hypothetical protein